MTRSLRDISTRATPQSAPASTKQVQNSAGGFTFQVGPLDRLRRFLILGTEGGTYYTTERTLTEQNAKTVIDLASDPDTGVLAVGMVVGVSTGGLAPKNDYALFALAILASSEHEVVRKRALESLPLVARTATHLFHFVQYMEQFRGWGRGARRAVAEWYTDAPAERLALQVTKYRQRDGWTHRDVLRLAHPRSVEPDTRAVLQYAAGKGVDAQAPSLIPVFESLQEPTTTARQAISYIEEFPITWEMLPQHLADNPQVWGALVDKGMPITALIRNLPRLTRYGLLTGGRLRTVVSAITNERALRNGRVHPIQVLMAMSTYGSGASLRGSSSWTPVTRVVNALDDAFYASFWNVTPTGKRTLLALDVSGSMTWGGIAGSSLTPRTASAAMALITARVEDEVTVVAFTGGGWGYSRGRQEIGNVSVIGIDPRRRLDDNLEVIERLPFGSTDCSLPMMWARANDPTIESFVVYTDNETWAGHIHPHQALEEYRQTTGVAARLAVVGMTATDFTIADPDDAGMLDVVGFDASAPNIMADFFRG